jgi:predicted nucleic acid-binding protein
VLVGDVVQLELLQGARSADDAIRIERSLRNLGITIRKTPDLIIGTYCIAHRHSLLHDGRDFEPMRVHLGLQVH